MDNKTNTYTDVYGHRWTAEGKKLSDETIANIIEILTHPELKALFNSTEIEIAQIALRTNISAKLDLIKKEVPMEEKGKVLYKS